MRGWVGCGQAKIIHTVVTRNLGGTEDTGVLSMFLSPLVKYFKNRLKWKIEHSVISIQKKTSRAGKL